MEEKVTSLLRKLQRFYWSPHIPESYTLSAPDGKPKGLGVLAGRDYGAFNVAFSCFPRLRTASDHRTAIKLWVEVTAINNFVIDGTTLSEWQTLLKEKEFYEWYSANRERINEQSRGPLDLACTLLQDVRRV